MADNIITTNITANADFTSLRTQLAAVTAQLVKLQETTAGTNAKLANQIAVMNKAFATTLTSTGQFSQHFVSLSSDVDKFGKNLDRGRLKLNDYYNAWNGHTKRTSTLIRDLAKQQVMLEQAVVQPIGKNAQGLMQYNVMVAKGLDEVKNKMAIARQEAAIMNKVMLDGSNQLINWGKNTQWAGRQLTVGLTVPLMAFGAAAQKAFREADAELVRLTKVYGGLAATSSADLAQVRKDVTATAREIAGSYGVAYKETIALAADLAATGQQGNDLIAATQQTTRLAVLGEVDRQEAMKATLAIQNAFKQNTDELAQSIDFLNAVENQTSTSLADLTEAIPKAGPVIKSLGGDVKDLALYLTAMKEGGVNASEGANAIKSAMASLINPTKVATEQFASFGIDLKGIVNNNAGDLTATIVSLQSALDKLNPLDKSRAIEQLFGKFQFARMSALFENLGKQGSQTLQVMDLMGASAVDLAQISERELKMMTESASGQFKRAWASVQADLASVGEQFLRISTKVLKVVDSIINFFKKLPDPVKTFLNALGGLTAIAGPLIMMAGVMGNFIGYVIKGIFHLRQLAKGGQAFKLLTPEIIAAEAAASGLATSFYTDTEATIVLSNAVNTLAESFVNLEAKANAAKISVQPAVTTVAGGVIMSGTPSGARMVDKDNPLVGAPYSRDMSHLIPSGMPQMGTIFGTVPGAKPVNIRIGKNPQAYMDGDLPMIPGLTSVGSTSTGIVADEAAKWHAMTAAISMQSEAEIKALKAEVMATGTVTASLTDSYQALLPQFTEITSLAAQEVRAIVEEVKANKITVEAARAKIIQLNASVEAMLAETTAMTATSMGRTANLTIVPLTSQPVVDPTTGKSNMKEMFHKGSVKEMADRIARALGGVRTSGAGYNIATTKPKFEKGGYVPGFGNSDTYHTTAAPGSFVINKASTEEHKPFINQLLGGESYYAEQGGEVPVVLTPGEAVIPPSIAQKNMPLMYALNGGPGNTSGLGRSQGGGISMNIFEGLKAWLQRNTDPNYDASLKNRVVLHDSAVLNHIGFSEDEAISMAKRDYDSAIARATDPRTGKIDRAKFNAIRIDQARAMQTYIDMQGLGRTKVMPDGTTKMVKYRDLLWKDKPEELLTGKRPQITAIKPTKALVETMMSRMDIDQVNLQRIISGFTRPDGTFDYASEHLSPDRDLFTEEDGQVRSNRTTGNAYNAQAGTNTINRFTNWLRSMTSGKFEDKVPLSQKTAQFTADKLAKELKYGQASQLLKRLPVIQRGHMMTKMMRLLLTRGKALPIQEVISANSGGEIPGQMAQRLFPGGTVFLGMAKSIKQVEQQRAMRAAMEKASLAVKDSRFAKKPVTEYGELLEPTSGRSFPVPGIGGLYLKGEEKVFVKPVLDEKAALAEMRATEIAREVHGLHAPKQKIVVMKDPTDPTGKRKLLALESKYDPTLASTDSNFTNDQYFRQLVASALRGDKDLGRGNLSGNVLSDVGPAGVFGAASGLRDYSGLMPSMREQAMINLLGVKGSNTKRFFAESTHNIPKGMTADQYHERMLREIEDALPKLKQTVARFGLNAEEKVVYDAMIKRLSDARSVNWREIHGIHSAVTPTPEKQMTPAAIAKMIAADELKRRQKGHGASLSDMAFKTPENGFAIGGLIGAITKGKAMHRIGAGFGKDTTGGWGVTSLEIGMAEKLFASTGLTKRTQRILYDKFAAALAKEMPYGYTKNAQGQLIKAIEPDVMDSVIRLAASSTLSAPEGRKTLSAIDRDILRKKFANWESRKDTPLTETLKQLIFKLEGREKGGPVNAGQPYIVGEKGPELFVPRNAGGIIPNKYGVGGQIAGGLAVAAGANFVASKVANPIVSMIIQQIGFMLPMMMQSAAMSQSGKGRIMSKLPESWTRVVGTTARGTDGKLLSAYGAKVEMAAASTSKWKNMAALAARGLTRLNLAIGLTTIAVGIGINRWKAHKESMRLNALGYGMTAEAASKAGLKFKDFNKTLQESVQRAKNIKEQNQLLYQSMTGSGTPLNITIEEYKKLKKTVKEQFGDQIKLINKTSADDQIDLAKRLKEQFMSMGMSAEEATKKIYVMYSLSNFSVDAAKYTVQSDGFNNIKTSVDAAAAAIRTYNDAVRDGLDATEQANALNTLAMGIDQAVAEEQAAAIKKRKKDKSKPSFVSAGEESQIKWDAELVALEKISNAQKYQKTVSQDTLNELKKTNPELYKIADNLDTGVSLWQKQRLIARGFTQDLRGFTAAQTNAVYEFNIAVTKSVEQVARNTILKSQYKELDRLKGLQEKYQKALKGQSVAQQISDRDRLAALQKQIDANNKLADARIKALDAAKKESDLGREIAKKQAEYDAALATGNTAAAQQASLDIEGLQSDLQYNAQVKAIEEATALKNAPLLKQIEAIQKKQQDLGDAAALAGEKLGDVTSAIDKQEGAINTLIGAMANYRTAIANHKDDLAKWKTSPEALGMIAAITSAATAAKVNLSSYPVDPETGKPGIAAGQGLFDSIASDLETSLIKNGLIVNGDVYINGKKVDVGTKPAGQLADPTKVAGEKSGSGRPKDPVIYKDAAGNVITEKEYNSMPVGAPKGTAEYIVPIAALSNKEFSNRDAATKAFFKNNNNQGTYVSGEYTYLATGGVRRGKELVGYWFSALPGSTKVKAYEEGGKITGPGTGTSDSIPAYLSNGEYVIKASSVQKYGVDTFDALNAQKFATGGYLKPHPSDYVFSSSFAESATKGKWISPEQNAAEIKAGNQLAINTAKEFTGIPAALRLLTGKSENMLLDLIAAIPIAGGLFKSAKFAARLPKTIEALNLMNKGMHNSPNSNLANELLHPLKYQAQKEQTLGNFTHFSLSPKYQAANPRYGDNSYRPNLDIKAVLAILKSKGFASAEDMAKYGYTNGLYGAKFNEPGIQAAIKDGFIGTKYMTGSETAGQIAPFFTGVKGHPLGKIVPKFGLGGLASWGFKKIPQIAGSAAIWQTMEELEKYLSLKHGADQDASGIHKWSKALARVAFNTAQGGLSGLTFGGIGGLFGVGEGLVEGLIGLAKDGSAYGVKGGSSLEKYRGNNHKAKAKQALDAMSWSKSAKQVAVTAGLSIPFGLGGNKVGSMLSNKYGASVSNKMTPVMNKVKSLFTKKSSSGLGGKSEAEMQKLIDSIYQKESLQTEDNVTSAYTIGGKQFAFQGYKEDLSDVVGSGIEVVPTDPIGILKAALSLNPKDKNLQNLIDNFKSGKIGDSEIDILDQIAAAVNISNTGSVPTHIDPDGFAMIVSALSGNKNAKSIIDAKTKILIDAVNSRRADVVNRSKEMNSGWTSRYAEAPADPSTVPVIHSTKYPVVRDNDGNVILTPYGSHTIGTDKAVPRASLHFTLEDTVKSHIYGSWDKAEKKIVTSLDSMISKNGVPANLQPVDTWWTKGPKQNLVLSGASVVNPYTDMMEYTRELIKRGLLKEGETPKLITVDPKTKDVLHMYKDAYTDLDRKEIAERVNEYGLMYVRKDEIDVLKGKEDELIERLALQEAKVQVGINDSWYKLDSYGTGNARRDDEIRMLADKLGTTHQLHDGTPISRLEMSLNRTSKIGNTGWESSSLLDADSIDAIRMSTMHGSFKTGADSLSDLMERIYMRKLGIATGGHVGTLIKNNKNWIDGPKSFSVPKFESGINVVPADMLAMLHKNEAVVPANMNPFNPNANNATMGGATYNITNNINGFDGDINQLSSMVTQKTIMAINTLSSKNSAMSGPSMTVGIK